MKKRDIILLHGWATRGPVWDRTKASLTSKYRVWTPDIPIGDPVEEYKDLVVNFMDNEGIGEAIIGGWSLGSMVAIELALSKPNRVKALALISGTSKFTPDDGQGWGIPPALVKRMKKRLKTEAEKTILDFYKLMFSPEETSEKLDHEIITRYLVKDKPWEMGEGLIGLDYLLEKDLREELPRINQTTLILHGDKDEICPVEGAYYLNNHIQNSDLVILRNGGHIPFLTQEDLFNAQLGEWLNGLSNT